jgi:hypothetical protein
LPRRGSVLDVGCGDGLLAHRIGEDLPAIANATLRFTDKVSNAHHGVGLPFNYWSKQEWEAAFRKFHLHVDVWLSKLGLYGIAVDWIFGRSLHFVTRLTFGS